MLVEETLFGTVDKVAKAIDRLQHFEPEEGYYLAFSGGKDSCVIKALADMAGVKYDAHYGVTTIDPPELIYFMREHHPDVIWDRPKEPFLQRMLHKGFPLRQSRWCCEEYKERGGDGRTIIIGVRWAESAGRSKRQMYKACFKRARTYLLSPIIEWSDDDVWEFIRSNEIPYCKLYDEGFKRIGCLLCPLAKASARQLEAGRYPRYTEMFRKAFRRLFKKRKAEGKTTVDRWADGDEMFDWWMTGKGNTNDSEGCFNWYE